MESAYLADIKSDLQDDYKSLSFSIRKNEAKFKTLRKGIRYYQGVDNGVTLDTLVSYAGLIGNYYHFIPNDYTYISLQQSGDFKIISNRDLKKSLVKLYGLLDLIEREQDNVLSGLDENYFPILMSNLDMVTGTIENPGYFESTPFKNNMGFVINEISTLIRLYKNAQTQIEMIDSTLLNLE